MWKAPPALIKQIFAGIFVLENSGIQRAMQLLSRAAIGLNLPPETSSGAVL
jgi:hypothetical protein